MHPKVSIIILNWNGLEDTIECLESLKKITYPNYQVIVVDNGSEGNDVKVLRERFGDYIQIIENDRNYGFSGGNNIAVRWLLNDSCPDYFLLLNNDTVVDAEFLTEMVKVTESDPSIGVVGPKTYFYDDPNRLQLVWLEVDMFSGQGIHVGAREVDTGQYENLTEVDYAQGSCLMVKRCVIDTVGLLDELYFTYWDEADYCIRTRQAGYKIVYVPKARIWHKVSSSAKKITGLSRYYKTRNSFYFIKKYGTSKQFALFLLRFFLVQLWRTTAYLLLGCRDIKSLMSFYKGIKDGIAGM